MRCITDCTSPTKHCVTKGQPHLRLFKLALRAGPGRWVNALMTARHVREREPWAGEGYERPQNFAPLDGGICVPAPPRGFATIFLSLMLALMTG